MWTYIQPFFGELILALVASQLMLLFGLSKKEGRPSTIRYIAIVALLAFAASGFITDPNLTSAFKGAFVQDDFSRYVKAILGIAGAAALLMARSYLKSERLDQYEFSLLTVYAVLGMGIMVSSRDLLGLYIGIELQSLALYVMAAFNRDSLRASEAGMKYFVLGALSSGLLLYGASLIYGFSGSLRFDEIAQAVGSHPTGGMVAGMVFLLCGLAFKISAAPFHMWTPDVYEGAPTPVTAFFAGAPKLAALALIARVLHEPFGGITELWQQATIVLALLSMIVGVFGGLMQTNIKRLMAYSSIANMGYALVALSAGTQLGVTNMLIFMTIYTVTVIGVFASILQMRIRDGMVEKITDLSGLSKTNSGLALVLTLLMLSLIGIPPLMGFWGKWFAFGAAMEAGLTWLVVVGLVASVVGAFYYLRIIRLMWFAEPTREFVDAPRSLSLIGIIATALIFPIMFLPFVSAPGMKIISKAAASLFAG
ncbi:MAG: NADH-quinone oxidoreductase subunit NuoN [Robiginitomaculum sp.]